MNTEEYETFIQKVKRVIFYIATIITILAIIFLGLSFLFRLLGANPATPIVAIIYVLSAPFRFPFAGMFADASRVPLYGDSTVDLTAIAAIFSYLVLYLAFILILNFLEKIFLQASSRKDPAVDHHPT